jgi:nucleoside-diphosphate-sugar epimerase
VKVLVTGPAGQIGLPLCRYLVSCGHEVWGVARFGDPAARDRVSALGVTTVSADLSSGDFAGLPDDFTHVVHLAAFQGGGRDYDHALRTNAEGTGLLLRHCRRAQAVLVMSTSSVYDPYPDPCHAYVETDPLGDAHAMHSPTYSVSKIAEEAVARTCARLFDVPVVIARMNVSYGPDGGLPAYHLDWMVGGQDVVVRWDPCPYSPIHSDDIHRQLESMLAAASVPATVVNWGGDEPVSPQQWCAYFGSLTGLTPRLVIAETPGTHRGLILDNTRRLAITGPCQVSWQEGMGQMLSARYPGGVGSGAVGGQAANLLSAYQEDLGAGSGRARLGG